MTSELSYWQRVDLTIAKLDDSTTETISFINRSWMDSDFSIEFWPILKNISDIGATMGAYIPGNIATSFSIDNSNGSFGYERKFSDKLELYTAINQTVVVYYGVGTPSQTAPSSWTTIFSGKVKSITENINSGSSVLVFNVDAVPLEKSVVSFPITSQRFTVAPSGSLGKQLPLIFGRNVQVVPVPVTTATTQLLLAYGISYSNGSNPKFLLSGVQSFFAKDLSDKYVEVASASATTTAVYSNTGSLAASADPWYEDYSAIANAVTVSTNYVVTHASVKFRGTGNAGFSGASKVRVGIWKDNGSGVPAEEIAFGERNKASFNASFRGATSSSFAIPFKLSKPVVFGESGQTYYVSITQGYDASASDIVDTFNISGSGQTSYDRRYQASGTATSGGESEWVENTGLTDVHFYWELFGLKYTDEATVIGTTAPGITYHRIKVEQNGSPNDIDISGVDFIFEANGITDDTTGIVTGSAGALIEYTNQIAKFLSLEYVASAWALSGDYDTGAHSSTHALAFTAATGITRAIGGKTEGRQTLISMLESICKNSACRLVYGSDGNYGIWAWGTNVASVATIYQEDIIALSLSIGAVDTVINDIRAYYSKGFTNTTFRSGLGQASEYSDYAGTLEWTTESGEAYPALVSTQSRDLFGKRELKEVTFDWITDSTSMESVAKYFLSVFALPEVNVEISVPLQKYSTIELLDVININTAQFPAYYGAYPIARAATYDGDPVELNSGLVVPRLNSWRAQVESKTIRFNPNSAPTLNITARLLINYPTDPT